MQEQIEDLKSYVHLSNKAPKFCVHNVGVLISTVRDEASSEISVIHHPEDDRPSHCGIWGTEKDPAIIGDLMAECVKGIFDALAR